MEDLIKKVAIDTGVTNTDADLVCKAFAGQLIGKVPALKQVIEDVFEDCGEAVFRSHILRLIQKLQEQQGREEFGKWKIPQQNEIISWEESKELF